MNGINIDEKYSLTNYRKTEGREGEGFIANLTKNGKRVDEVADYGDGGATRVYLRGNEMDELTEFAKKFYDNIGVTSFCDGIAVNFVNDLADYIDSVKSAKRRKKTTIVQVVRECEYLNTLRISYAVWNSPYDERLKRHLEKTYKEQPYRVLSPFVG